MYDFDDPTPGIWPESETSQPSAEQPTAILAPAGGNTRRRAIRFAVIGSLAVVLLAVPAAAFAVFGGGGDSPAGHGRAEPVTAAPADPTETPSTAPEAGSTTSLAGKPAAEAAMRPGKSAPDGRFTIDELAHSTLDLPAWPKPPALPCPSGAFTFQGNPTQVGPDSLPTYFLKIDKVAYADVDRDGAPETVALIACYLQGGDHQVVVFDRNRSGHVVTVGLVVASSRDGPIETLFDVRPAASGRVQVEVGDVHPCCGVTSEMAEHQWRTYTFTGRAFVQTGGPRRFTPVPEPTTLSATATPLQFGAPVDGARHGTFTVTVANTGTASAPGVELTINPYLPELPQPLTMTAPGCPVVTITGGPTSPILCHIDPLAAGAERQYTFQAVLPLVDDPAIPTAGNPRAWTIGAQGEQLGVRLLPYRTSTELLVSRAG